MDWCTLQKVQENADIFVERFKTGKVDVLGLPCVFSHRFRIVAWQKGSIQWCRRGLEEVTQHHKHFPSGGSPSAGKRLSARKTVTPKQAGNYKEKPSGF